MCDCFIVGSFDEQSLLSWTRQITAMRFLCFAFFFLSPSCSCKTALPFHIMAAMYRCVYPNHSTAQLTLQGHWHVTPCFPMRTYCKQNIYREKRIPGILYPSEPIQQEGTRGLLCWDAGGSAGCPLPHTHAGASFSPGHTGARAGGIVPGEGVRSQPWLLTWAPKPS